VTVRSPRPVRPPLLAAECRSTLVGLSDPAAAWLAQLDERGSYGAHGEDDVEYGIDGTVRERHQLAGDERGVELVPVVGVD